MPLYPGSKIGVIGGGQLGRMLILECRRMDYLSVVIDPDMKGPAAQVADKIFHPDSVLDFVRECDVATCEFEHFDINIVKQIEENVPVFPSSSVLEIKRNRISEKRYLSENGFPVPRFWIFDDISGVRQLAGKTDLMVKTSTGGYDGKGLYEIKKADDYEGIKGEVKGGVIAEEFIHFAKEISVICARDRKGNIVLYPAVENVHKEGILLYTIAPAGISGKAEKRTKEIVSELAHTLGLVGLLVVEMFLLENDEALINEFAPRPHNSGHYTMDACDISQFEMLLRVICGLPLTVPELLCPAAMLNILGKGASDMDIDNMLSLPGVKLHLYGKKEVRDKRKMGHINILGRESRDVSDKLAYLKNKLYGDARKQTLISAEKR